MTDQLKLELEQFAVAMLAAQHHLLELLRLKRQALASANMPALDAMALPESQAAERLQTLIASRANLLAKARHAGFTEPTLTDLARKLGAGTANGALRLLETSRLKAVELQREGWVHWVLANRSANYYRELLDRIAHGGKKSPTYHQGETAVSGGTLLNASA